MKPLIKQVRSFPITIYIGGRYNKAVKLVQEYCDDVGFCVTIKPTLYVFKNGQEHGIEVGLINYPRFPADATELTNKAIDIANKLREGLNQESFTIQTPNTTIWYSYRKEDVDKN